MEKKTYFIILFILTGLFIYALIKFPTDPPKLYPGWDKCWECLKEIRTEYTRTHKGRLLCISCKEEK